ncbi:MAG: urea carboxylase-associated family protein [Candidatus Rokubacteria bacterium]|nr:urea carboxylase-associated family protein [Candidatus Rokubacteria bacterium]
MTEKILVPAGTARATVLRAGQVLRIVNVAGKQVADFVAFNAGDLTEALSTMHTIVSLGRLFPTTGDQLRTNRRRPMLEFSRDDAGRHDMIIAACDPWRYEYDFGVTGHRNCSDNFIDALREWGIQRHQLPQPVNLFQNMSYPDGQVRFSESLAKPGDTVELRALIDVVVAVSACPMDLNPISGFRVTDIALEVL